MVVLNGKDLFPQMACLLVEIFAFDKGCNKAAGALKLERDAAQEAAGVVFSDLNPSNKKGSP